MRRGVGSRFKAPPAGVSRTYLALLACCIWTLAGRAAQAAPPSRPAEAAMEPGKLPGYFDFSILDVVGKEDLTLNLTLEGDLLRAGAGLAGNGDADLGSLLSRLKQIRIQTFDMNESRSQKVQAKVGELGKQLEGKGWQPIVRAHDKDSQTCVYLKWGGQVIEGVAVMSVEADRKASFVNVIGDIDPEQVGRLGASFDIDGLDDLKIDLEAKIRHSLVGSKVRHEDKAKDRERR